MSVSLNSLQSIRPAALISTCLPRSPQRGTKVNFPSYRNGHKRKLGSGSDSNLNCGPRYSVNSRSFLLRDRLLNDILPLRRTIHHDDACTCYRNISRTFCSSNLLLGDTIHRSAGIFRTITRKNCLVNGNLQQKSIYTSSTRFKDKKEEIKTPEDQDPSLEYERNGRKFENGPDQVIPSKAMYTWHARGAVKLSTLGTKPGSERPPISIPSLLRKSVERSPNTPAIAIKRDGHWIQWSNEEYLEDIMKAAKAFIALGLEKHNSVCILGTNSPEWFIADLGTIFAGGIPAGIYCTNSAATCAFIAEDSKANIYVVEDEQQLSKILQYKDSLPNLKAIVQYKGVPGADDVLSWKDLMELGAQQSDTIVYQRLKEMAVNQCATLIYTSGTTGSPKGVMLSHDNITWLASQGAEYSGLMNSNHDVVSYLPLSHIAAQTADIYMPMLYESTVYFAGPDALKGTLVNTLKEIQPTIFLAVPRVWEKFYEALKEIGGQNSGLKLKLVDWAKEQGKLYNERFMAGHPNPSTLQFRLADKLVLSKIREALGLSRAQICMSAAAPISMDILEYFMSLNVLIGEAYGLSECSGPHSASISSRGEVRFGSIGKQVEGCATKLDQPQADGSGEICLGGRHVLIGYLNREETTRKAIDKHGWLHTEDLGRIDEDGFIYVTGRLKELLITAGGENVAPVPIEDNIKQALPCLSNAMVIGDRLKFLSVLITFKTETNANTLEPLDKLTNVSKQWVEKHGACTVNTLKDVLNEVYKKKNSKLINAINAGVMLANSKSVSRAQKVQKWVILPKDFSIPGGELGPTLKLKRMVVTDKYKDIIDDIYKDGLDMNSTGALG